ncbi:MAG: ribonucleoside-diphosphate reductase, adenosylcobalamin-dependent [Candidatus Kerfeldbacteria bacterium CG08_land_8_20_14_0_20_40_16]|uniref:Vitamin B12-dependent ribonucleotide reductase n=1 Tax=Candidatus Kerfeldbacteria bacterium CG08_land_8_20_14_0_20_40_16 TaxID=2014244 RepID=A0A2H0YV42_9BACT|nr:MAG: ribonucleoside-diphosphate reductase, adenosylcobalamin-dependent [Candidatus Kerfeldbacteria bacterium CG08_land_8_20_14_0_20_40_16]
MPQQTQTLTSSKIEEEIEIKDSAPETDKKRGLSFQRLFTYAETHPFDEIKWEKRDAVITDPKGKIVFEQKEVEVPDFWSQNATNIVASKYFYGDKEKKEREFSVKQLIDRVSRTITDWGKKDNYFASEEDAENFYNELTYLLVNQYTAFNSPVWFNCGVDRYDSGSGKGRYYWNKEQQKILVAEDDYTHPQCSACFINSVEDSMDSILNLAKTEGMLFKFGSGAGTNLSPIRSSKEHLSGGGQSSGPVSFMKGFDAFAGVIKSGGKTRRAAKMVILDVNHPDIMEFIGCKANEEKKAWALIDAGYDGSIDGEAYSSIFFQNANNSVRVTDEFMEATLNDGKWKTRTITTGKVMDTFNARDLLRKIAEATHICGDPGLQFDTAVNDWHTCLNTDRIYASNPCSEYMFINDSACNLVSLNLTKFLNDNGEFDVASFKHAVDVVITAQEIIVDRASYPTQKIAENSHLFRALGLGYANLGALLMYLGLPYNSDRGRALAGVITAIMTAEAYKQSSIMAKEKGVFDKYNENREPFLRVIRKHRDATKEINGDLTMPGLKQEAEEIWNEVLELGNEYGFRNAQVTLLAPTGTIGFLMDCDTTGIEPDIALVKYKKLVGGGYMKIVNNTIPMALKRLGYNNDQVKDIIDYIDKNDTIEGTPYLKEEDLPVFDCAFRPSNGVRSIHHLGHIKMMSAVQPFLSGAISKTVNMPENSTVEDIMDTYIQAWKLGLKAIAIYRDSSKRTQPLNNKKEEKDVKKEEFKVIRNKLPDERQSITHKFEVAGHEGYITVGLYEDGRPGEIFITMSKDGSTLSGIMDAFATSISLNLQYGVPLKVLVNKFTHTRFEPAGFTNNKQIPMAKSIMDYIFRWLAIKFLNPEEVALVHNALLIGEDKKELKEEVKENSKIKEEEKDSPNPGEGQDPLPAFQIKVEQQELLTFQNHEDAPFCEECGSIMIRNGSCYKCLECGSTSGCS